MNRRTSLAFTCALLGGAAVAIVPACMACNDIACLSGFEWFAQAADATPLDPGEYLVSATLDGEVYEITCTVVADGEGTSQCAGLSGPVEGRFVVEVSLTGGVEQPATGFYLYALDDDATERTGGLGPEDVEITVTTAGGPLLAVDYQLEYEADDDYWGDPACGSCQAKQERSAQW